ncbi:unnamed protein product [Moneuplotes crassus]|uniref:Uncharacterized protein n=2 Tax=Euplotes crassus TaxID=5936 RepID=A0AAD2D960_EUPCR|nr:unnamed protein product [Moneuplotes crassus]
MKIRNPLRKGQFHNQSVSDIVPNNNPSGEYHPSQKGKFPYTKRYLIHNTLQKYKPRIMRRRSMDVYDSKPVTLFPTYWKFINETEEIHSDVQKMRAKRMQRINKICEESTNKMVSFDSISVNEFEENIEKYYGKSNMTISAKRPQTNVQKSVEDSPLPSPTLNRKRSMKKKNTSKIISGSFSQMDNIKLHDKVSSINTGSSIKLNFKGSRKPKNMFTSKLVEKKISRIYPIEELNKNSNITTAFLEQRKIGSKMIQKFARNKFWMKKKTSRSDKRTGGESVHSVNTLKFQNSTISNRRGSQKPLYTPSNKRERLLSNQNEFSTVKLDPIQKKRVDTIVKKQLDDPNQETKIDLNDYFNHETAQLKYPQSMKTKFKTKDIIFRPERNIGDDGSMMVFANTRFNKMKIKESDIPIEVIFNKEVDLIKLEERKMKIKTRPIHFMITDNFAGEEEIESVAQGIDYQVKGKGVIKYIIDNEVEKPRVVVYNRDLNTQPSAAPTKEINIQNFIEKKKLKPFLYPKKSLSDKHSKSGRYVEIISKVIKRIKELRFNEEGTRRSASQDDKNKVTEEDILKEMINTNFEVIQPNLDYIMEKPLDDKYLNFKQPYSVKRKIQLSKLYERINFRESKKKLARKSHQSADKLGTRINISPIKQNSKSINKHPTFSEGSTSSISKLEKLEFGASSRKEVDGIIKKSGFKKYRHIEKDSPLIKLIKNANFTYLMDQKLGIQEETPESVEYLQKKKEDAKRLKEFLDKLEKTLITGETLSNQISSDFIFAD